MADENLNSNGCIPGTPSSTKFAVFIPSNDSLTGVYNSKAEALSVIQGFKGARFTLVRDSQDAEIFFSSEKQILSTPRPATVGSTEESCPFASPQVFGQVMGAVNRSDINCLKNLVDKNPLYLVTKVDSPTILHQGARYNALHLCANKNLANVAQFIVETLRSGELFSRLYPNDLPDTRQSRVKRLLDLYINSPEKYRSETPLHLASKMGNVEMVWFLTSQEECILSPTNVDGQTPSDINCSRLSSMDENRFTRIEQALQGQFFVAILRSYSNPLEPLVRGPIRAVTELVTMTSFLSESEKSFYRVSAFMGPTSQEHAKEIYETLKKPSKRRKRLNDSFRLENSLSVTPNRSFCLDISPSPKTPRRPDPCVADPKHGLENCARKLCQQSFVPFYEHFEFFIECGIDVLTHEGLSKLETFLANKHKLYCRECDLCKQPLDISADTTDGQATSDKEFDSAPVVSQDTARNSWGIIVQPIRWFGSIVHGLSNYLYSTPATREPIDDTCPELPNNANASLSSRKADLTDSFIESFAAMSLSDGADQDNVKLERAELSSHESSSNSTDFQSDPPTIQNKKAFVFLGRSPSKPSDEDFHIFNLIAGDGCDDEDSLLSTIDYPYLVNWYEQVRYIKRNTLTTY